MTTNRRYQSEFLSWKNPDDQRSSTRSSFTDRQIASNLSNAVKIDGHLRVRPFTRETKLGVQDSRLKREIIREMHQQIPLTLKIGIPFDKSAEKRKRREDEEHRRRIEENVQQIKMQVEEQNRTIEFLQEKIESISKSPPPRSRPKPFPEDIPLINLSRTMWK